MAKCLLILDVLTLSLRVNEWSESLGILLWQPKCCPKSPRNTRWCIVSKHSAKKTSISYALDTSGASKVAFFFSSRGLDIFFFDHSWEGTQLTQLLVFQLFEGMCFASKLLVTTVYVLFRIIFWWVSKTLKPPNLVCILYTFKTVKLCFFSESNLGKLQFSNFAWETHQNCQPSCDFAGASFLPCKQQQQQHSLKLTAVRPWKWENPGKGEVCYWKPAFLGANC